LASRLAVDVLPAVVRAQKRESMPIEDRLEAAFDIVNASIQRRQRGRFSKMGTTLAVLATMDGVPDAVRTHDPHWSDVNGVGTAMVAHIGDSRVYRLRGGQLEQLTRDHSYVEHLKASGMDAPARYAHMLVRAVGRRDGGRPELRPCSTRRGDVFLLCTDGVSGVLPEPWMRKMLQQPRPPEEIAQALVDRAVHAGGADNATAVVVRTE
jgi:serine/threonine protein phosphatase PrpC